ncbi:MAG: hypothetical protein KatS3mg040_0658 [Candidatus Kapaibacterium sp.]|nr:MAG: hypothetical protein KatS3mg040_0658 [Candidatus Kapabacteria bacterium]
MIRRFALILTAGIGLALGTVALILFSPLPISGRHVLFVPEGMTVQKLLDTLDSTGAVRVPWLWRQLAWGVGKFRRVSIRMGSYELSPAITHVQLFSNLLTGSNRLVQPLTIYEGETTPHLAGSLARVLGDDSARVYRLIVGDSLARAFDLEGAPSLEGYLLPATYELYKCEPTEHAIKRIVRHFDAVWQERFASKARQQGLSRQQVLTLASIVEGEVVNPVEYRRIAGVYWNRLRRHMKLEADPTVQYALGFPPRRLSFRDYQIEHPYNTYRIVGLTTWADQSAEYSSHRSSARSRSARLPLLLQCGR